MRKSYSFLAITAMAILITAVSVASCKKDSDNAPNQKGYTVRQATDIRQLEDPRAYILDFKKNLTESRSNEAYSLEDAAWHLACLANLEFCNVNVNYDDFLFDTLEMAVNVSDGVVLLGDLREAYEQMCTGIQQFRKGFNHSDQNLYYINLSINANGNTKIALMSSYKTNSRYLYNHTWYFSDFVDAVTECDTLFCFDSVYAWNTVATLKLQNALNLYEHHNCSTSGLGGIVGQCYLPTRSHSFDYHTLDPYDSDYFNGSRLFVMRNTGETLIHDMTFLEMCYCFDSYLGLGYDFISSYPNESPVCWKVEGEYYHEPENYWHYHYHVLSVDYGQLTYANPPGPNDD